MDLMVTQMTANRAYSKARRRLHSKLDELKKLFIGMRLKDQPFDLILVSFVDEPPGLYREIQNKDRVYQVELGLPEMESYKPENDPELLMAIADQLRTVLERCPVDSETRDELLRRFSQWESAIRKESFRIVETQSKD